MDGGKNKKFKPGRTELNRQTDFSLLRAEEGVSRAEIGSEKSVIIWYVKPIEYQHNTGMKQEKIEKCIGHRG